MPLDSVEDGLLYVPGNDFCCLCSWWHDRWAVSDHQPMLCLLCLDDYFRSEKLRDCDPTVMPARKKRAA